MGRQIRTIFALFTLRHGWIHFTGKRIDSIILSGGKYKGTFIEFSKTPLVLGTLEYTYTIQNSIHAKFLNMN